VIYGAGIICVAAFAGSLIPLVLFAPKRYEFYENSFKVRGKDFPYSDISKIECDGTRIEISVRNNRKRMLVPVNPSMGLHESLYTWLGGNFYFNGKTEDMIIFSFALRNDIAKN
jgi:hypothetical protein